jgi:UDP-2,3-diacylglucosamine pyrophosphatase LpxH
VTDAPQAELDGDVLNVKLPDGAMGWEQWFLLISDVHWDNPHCDRKLLEKHLKQAKERNAPVLSFGDFFCAMQGKYDQRASKDSIRPEHTGGNYLDLLVDTASDFWLRYLPPAKHADGTDAVETANIPWLMLADGNHETSIRSKLETDLTKRLAKATGAHAMGYSGFVKFRFFMTGGGRSNKVLYFHHGSGGGGPVTKGVIRSNRQAVYLPDAQIVIGGHVHESWLLVQPRVRLSNSDRVYLDNQYHLCGSTYKQEFVLHGGFHVERGRPPKPLGGWWMRFYWDNQQHGNVGVEFTLAT